MNEFLDKLSAVLETSVGPESRFREVDGWSSLMAFGLLVTLENDFGCRLTVEDLRRMNTIGDLARAAAVAYGDSV